MKFVTRLTLLMSAMVGPVLAQTKLGEACDDMIITDSLLLPQAQRLADYRTENTRDAVKKACVVTLGDLAQAFPEITLPRMRVIQAVRRKLADSRLFFQYLTLFGDASFTPGSPHDHVPTFGYTQNLSHTPEVERVSFDAAYALYASCDSCLGMLSDTLVDHYDFNRPYPGSEGYPAAWRERKKPSFALGRIPAHTVEQARAYVDKVIAYEAEGEWGPGQQTYGVVADDDRHGPWPEPIFQMPGLQNEVWASLDVKPMFRRVSTVEYDLNPDSTLPAATEKLVNLWNSDLQFLFYFGHGSPQQWSDEKVFDMVRDSGKLIPKTRQPIVVPAACSTAPFAIDTSTSMAEALLFSRRGAIAWIGGTGESYPGPNNTWLKSWLTQAPQGPMALGDLPLKGWQSSELPANLSLDPWTLLGDPALMVRFPKQPLTLANASTRNDLQLPLPAGPMDSIYFEIVRVDTLTPAMKIRQEPFRTEAWDYERETVLHSERKALQPGAASFGISLADTLNPQKVAVKVLVWNQDASHYGYFPLHSLSANPLALRGGLRKHPDDRSRRVTSFGMPGRPRAGAAWAGPEADARLGSAQQGWVRTLHGRKVPVR